MNKVKVEDGMYLIKSQGNVGNNPAEWIRIPDDEQFQNWLIDIIKQASTVLAGEKN